MISESRQLQAEARAFVGTNIEHREAELRNAALRYEGRARDFCEQCRAEVTSQAGSLRAAEGASLDAARAEARSSMGEAGLSQRELGLARAELRKLGSQTSEVQAHLTARHDS